jgi:hypothetical protein
MRAFFANCVPSETETEVDVVEEMADCSESIPGESSRRRRTRRMMSES